MKDVARLAEVSSMTVSRVLKNDGSYSLQTKKQVLDAVAVLGYQRNMQASSLAAGRKYQIAFFYDNPRCSYMVDVLIGMLTGIQEKGYHIIIESFSLDNIKKIIENNSVDGVLLPPPYCEFKEVHKLLDQYGMPFVRMAAGFEFSNTHSVRTNDKEMAKGMTQHLIELGHKKIGFIQGHTNHGVSFLRLQGYKQALEAAELPFNESLCEQGFFTFESGYSAAIKLLDRHKDMTAIFACSDVMAHGALRALHEKDLKVPEDISLAGFDDTSIAQRMYPPLTTVHQPSEEMAICAIDILVGVLNKKHDNQFITKHLDSHLEIRESTACVNPNR